MNRETDPEVIKRTFWLLRRIKRFFQTFKFREDDLSMVNDWAEMLEPVIDWTPRGLTLYVQDGKTKEPSVAEIYFYADKARRMAEAERQAAEYADIDPEKCPGYVKATGAVSEEEQRRNIVGHYDKLRGFARRMVNEGRVSPDHLEKLPPVDFSSVQQTDELPFVPDPEEIMQFEQEGLDI